MSNFRNLLTCTNLVFGAIFIFSVSCTDKSYDFITESNLEKSLIQYSKEDIAQFIDGQNWVKHVSIQKRDAKKCYSCISEDVLGGAEGCFLRNWVGGPIGCAVGGALVASYRSIREANTTGFSKERGPSRRKSNAKPITPLINNPSSSVGKAHNQILEELINDNIDISDLDAYYSFASNVISQISELSNDIINDYKFKFAIKHTLAKINQGYSIRLDENTHNFIYDLSKIDGGNDSKILHNKILQLKNKSFEDSSVDQVMQNREQMEAIGYYTHHFWNN